MTSFLTYIESLTPRQWARILAYLCVSITISTLISLSGMIQHPLSLYIQLILSEAFGISSYIIPVTFAGFAYYFYDFSVKGEVNWNSIAKSLSVSASLLLILFSAAFAVGADQAFGAIGVVLLPIVSLWNRFVSFTAHIVGLTKIKSIPHLVDTMMNRVSGENTEHEEQAPTVVQPVQASRSTRETAEKIEAVYTNAQITCRVIDIVESASVVQYICDVDIHNQPVSTITGKVRDLETIFGQSVRIDTVLKSRPGFVSIEIGKGNRDTVALAPLLEATSKSDKLSVPIGLGLNSQPLMLDISKAPHILVCGATGSGKSVCIKTILNGLTRLYPSSELNIALIDMKKLSFTKFSIDEYMWAPLADETDTAISLLNDICIEIDTRNTLLKSYKVEDIFEYNDIATNKMKPMVLIIEELADLLKTKDQSVLGSILRIARLGRACGIHMILSTQRPDAKIISGELKVNIPTRIAFSVASGTDSDVILDEKGAETLLGQGDGLIKTDLGTVRFQCALS